MFPLFRETDDQGNPGPRIMDITLPAGKCSPVIREVEHNGVLRRARLFQFPEPFPHPLVHEMDVVVVTGPVLPDLRGIGMVWCNDSQGYFPGRHDALGRVPVPASMVGLIGSLALMRQGGVEDGKEGLALLPVPVVRLVPVRVPANVLPARPLPVDRHVVVGLGVIGAVITGLAEDLRVVDHGIRNTHAATMIMKPEGGGIHPGDKGRACYRANRGGGIGMDITHSLPGKPVQVGSLRMGIPVAPEVRAVVLARDPEDVGTIRAGCQERPGGGQDCE